MSEARCLAGAELAVAMRDSRATTLALVADLDDEAWALPQRAGANPIAWELGHLAWFAEFWILRGPHRATGRFIDATRAPRIAGSDAVYDSARLAHAERWQHAWPARAAIFATLEGQLDACTAAIPDTDDDAALYFHRLALFHEDMHGEAFAWLRAGEGHAMPPAPAVAAARSFAPHTTIAFDATTARIGRSADDVGFSFDNELSAHDVALDAFEIDSAPIGNGAFLRFVEAGGYEVAAYWPGAAGAWKASSRAKHPRRWRRRQDGDWEALIWDRWQALDPAQAVVHVSAFEAEAYCRWAGCRLPRAAEWEHAAQSPQMQWGRSVWEWTADAFLPYPGFAAGPYIDYSAPWFGSHRELRGGSRAAAERMHDRRYRNFFTPERNDVFAGFRTAAN